VREWTRGFALGYIQGVVDTLWITGSPALLCAPDGLKFGQLRLVVRNYLAAHPEKLHLAGSFVVAAALIEAFPCGPSRR
jgi:Rap1a immunity proteins